MIKKIFKLFKKKTKFKKKIEKGNKAEVINFINKSKNKKSETAN